MAKMTKNQLIDAIAEGTQLAKTDIKGRDRAYGYCRLQGVE